MRSAGLVVGLAVAGVLSELLVGPAGWGWPSDPFIAWQLRLPRLMLALGAGAGLAACGVLLQVLLRNPLASPYTLGVGSASALGASLVLVALPTFHVGLGAWLGALAATGLVIAMSQRAGLDAETLILCGVAVALCASAGVLLLHFLADRATSAAMIRWTMGGLASVGMTQGLLGLLPTCLGALWLFKVIPQLNLLSLSDDWALSRGVATERLQVTILVVVALWTGAIVAQAGPIAFVGLIAPHMARRRFGHDLRRYAPAALGIGAGLLCLCDALSRLVVAPGELPVGVLTALLGGPAFLALLIQRR
ncbi:MAG: iron ABC transporter permease [Myxococcota bacterium]|nr:iron ABC transporter permease [Myxococcota bacterium]